MKKRIGMFLAAAMAALNAHAVTAKSGKYVWEYEVENGVAIVTSVAIGSDWGVSLSIPSSLGGYPVKVVNLYSVIDEPKDLGDSGYEEAIASVTVPNGVTNVDSLACLESMTSVSLPSSLLEIGDSAFEGCGVLSSITIPTSVTKIGPDAFADCSSLASVSLPSTSSLLEIGNGAFSDCTSLASVSLPAKVTKIGNGIFGYCSSLTSVTLASGNTKFTMQGGALYTKDMTELIEVMPYVTGAFTIPGSVKYIRPGAFAGSKISIVHIPASVVEIGSGAFSGADSLSSIAVASGNSAFVVENGMLYNALKTRLVRCPVGYSGDYYSPSTLQWMDNGAFRNCTMLESVVLNEGFTEFSGGNRVIRPSMEYMPNSTAFHNCKSLRYLYLPPSTAPAELIIRQSACVVEMAGNAYYLGINYGFNYEVEKRYYTVTDPFCWVAFDPNGGILDDRVRKLSSGDALGTLPVPVRRGWKFDGWWLSHFRGSVNGNRQINEDTIVTHNTIYVAHWIEDASDGGDTPPPTTSYTVTFDVNGNGALRNEEVTRKVAKGMSVGELPTPMVPNLANSGFGRFQGWFTAKTGGTQISSDTIVTKDVTYYAHWKYFRYVVLDANGGEFSKGYADWWPFVEDGATLGSLPAVLRPGYTFDGWYTAASGGTKVSADTKITATASNIREPLKYYAHWSADVSFPDVTTWKFYEEADDDEGLNLAAWEDWDETDVAFWIGEGINMAIPVDGNLSASDIVLVAGTYSGYGTPQVVSDEWMFAKHCTALEQAIGYDPYEDYEYDQGAYGLVFEDDVRGGNYSLSMDIWPNKKIVPGRQWILLEIGGNPTKGCKTFYLGVKGRDDVGYSRFRIYATPDQGVSQSPSNWSSQRELAVLPMPIGGGTTTGSGMYVNGTRVSLSAKPVAGYEFEGWYDQSSGQQLGTSTSLTYVMGDANSVIIAKFTLATECFVTFDANGGTPKTQNVKQRSETPFVLPKEPTRVGYTFAGWWTEKNGGVKVTDETVFLTGVYETLYAHWLSERVVQAQVLEKAFSGVVTVELDEADNIVVTLTNDVSGTVEIPDNVGAVTIDLNGYDMTGDDGPAIRIVKGDGEGAVVTQEATRLTIVDTSNGEKGRITGGGESAGIEVDEDAATGVKLDVEEGVGVFNGDGSEQELKPKLIGTGKVTTPKTWKTGQKVTWKATADKGSVFARWEGPLVDSLNLTKNDRRNPSLAFAVPEGFDTNMVTAVFIPIDDDGLYSLGITQTEFELKEAVSDVWVTDDSQSYVTATVSGLPTGLKFDAKKMTIAGTPTKSGVYWVQIKAKNASGYQWAENVKMTVSGGGAEAKEPKLTRTVYYPLTVICATEGGTVSGTGVYAEGKKVTIKATPAKGYVFAGWYDESVKSKMENEKLGSAASMSVTVPEMRYVFAKFVTVEEDRDSIELAVDGEELRRDGGIASYQVNIWAGVYMEWPVAASALSETKVKVAGLPSGLKFTEKDIMKKGSKTEVEIPANTIYGAPTAASKVDAKNGVVPSDVKVTVTTAGKTTATFVLRITVDPLPDWSVGTFTGFVLGTENGDLGSATMTIAANGKVSGKIALDGTNWTFKADSFSRVEDGPSSEVGSPKSFVAEAVATAGKATRDLVLEVAACDSGRGATALPNAVVEGTFGDGEVKMLRNMWKDKETATAAKETIAQFAGVYTVSVADGEDHGSGYLSLTVGKDGSVKAAGKLADGTSVSATSPLMYDEEAGWFVMLYAAPSAYKGGAFAAAVGFDGDAGCVTLPRGPAQWTSRNPQSTGDYGEGFDREVNLVGSYYSKLDTLRKYYESVRLDLDGAPELGFTFKETSLNEQGKKVTTSSAATAEAVDTLLQPGLTAMVNENGAIVVAKATKPVQDKETKEWSYDGANDGGLTLSFTQATGIFKGSYTFWYDYVSAYDETKAKDNETRAHTSKKVSFEGILVHGEEPKMDGFYLWDATGEYEDPKTGKAKSYKYKQSFPVRLLAE